MKAPFRSSGLPMVERIIVAVAALACLAAGGVATFVTTNGPGSATLIAGGIGLLVVAFLGGRLESFKFGGVEATLHAAEQLYGRAETLEAGGDHVAAGRLRSEAHRLLLQVAPDVWAYEDLRRMQPPGPERTARMHDAAVLKALSSRRHRPSAEAVNGMFLKGEDGDRVFALVLMREDPDAASLDSILDGIVASRSAFEQYLAVEAAERLVQTGLDDQSRARVRRALLAQTSPGGWIKPTTDRWPLAQRLLGIARRLTAPGPTAGRDVSVHRCSTRALPQAGGGRRPWTYSRVVVPSLPYGAGGAPRRPRGRRPPSR